MAVLLSGKPVAEHMCRDIRLRCEKLSRRGVTPTLGIVRVGRRSFPKLKILYPNPRLRYFQNTLLCGYSESSASSWLPLDKESVSSI